MADLPILKIQTDGASRGNPGAAAFGYVLILDEVEIAEEGDCLGDMTNNQAEYTALVRALEHALQLTPDHALEIFSDSELMVKQINGAYKVKNADLKPLYEQVKELLEQFPSVRVSHVRRGHNKRADQLCNEALDGKRTSAFHGGQKQVLTPKRKPEADKLVERLREVARAWAENGGTDPTPEALAEELKRLIGK